MNQLSSQKRAQIVGCLVEGMSIRATVRVTGAAKNTVTKLLADLGSACAKFQDRVMRDLPCQRLQVDEIWSFCYAKKANVPDEHHGEFGFGDIYTFVAIDADTKLVPTYLVGERKIADATVFMEDLAQRMSDRIQLTTDGYKAYVRAVPNAFGHDIDYAVLLKLYGKDSLDDHYYGPPVCIGQVVRKQSGRPDKKHISTSYVERQNLTMRMGMRRFTRLTNGFSRKVENLTAAVSLHFAYYNFCRVHQTLKTTPAVRAGITDHVWTVEELVGLLDQNPRMVGNRKHGSRPKALTNRRISK